MKRLSSLVLALALALFASGVQAKSYVNGIDPNYPPFAYIDEKTGEAAGFDVDSLNWIAKNMGFEVKHKPMAWDGIIPALLANQIDMVCSGMSITPQRAEQVQFSDPYWTVSRVFLVPADADISVQEILSKPIKIGVQRGTSEASAIKEEQEAKGYPFELRYYDSAPLAVEDLQNGRIQAALMDELPADDAISKGRAVKKAGTHGEPDGFGVAMRKGESELRKLIDEGYKRLKEDPYWQELQKKYLNK
ncbi:MAG: ABC transporter substrate-binding protein [Desulfovibrio sp.]|nr:ABC transporter substrate-binding protein [Desulfovibrio sp.]